MKESHCNQTRSQAARAILYRGVLPIFPFVLYLLLSLVAFARPLITHMGTTRIGTSPDSSLFMWFLEWWPHTISHGLNPFITGALWAPQPFNIAWTTCIPLLSVFGSPLTLMAGPIVSFNILCILSLPLAAWCAQLVCYRVTRAFWPSLLGGLIFGFSPYMLAHLSGGQLHLVMTFPIPLAVYLVLLGIEGRLSPAYLCPILALTLAAQFLISLETFATMTLFAAMTLFLGWSFAPSKTRSRLLRIILQIAGAYALATVVLSPYLYFLFFSGSFPGRIWSPKIFSTDLLNLLIPTHTNELGLIPAIDRLSVSFRGGAGNEAGAYLSIPLIIISIGFARKHWREPLGKTLIDVLVIIIVLSLGPFLKINGHEFFGMPEKLLADLPLFNSALPARFSAYAFLDLAVITTLWLSEATIRNTGKIAVALIVIFGLLPNCSASTWSRPVDLPEFFSEGIYKRYIFRNETVVALPYYFQGDSMLWQSKVNRYFRMAGGWTGPMPEEFTRWPIVNALVDETFVPDAHRQLLAFLAKHDVTVIIDSDDDPQRSMWNAVLAAPDVVPVKVAGVTLYRIPAQELENYKGLTAPILQAEEYDVLFRRLLFAADRYLSEDHPSGVLIPLKR